MTKVRFRERGAAEWTFIDITGDLVQDALSALGTGLSRYHVQVWVDGEWEDLL